MFEGMTDAEWKRFWRRETAELKRGSTEWDAAWQGLADISGDRDKMAEHPGCFEVWGYMMTFRRDGKWRHEFRHRVHPRGDRWWVLRVPASAGWTPADEHAKRRKRRALH